MKRILLLVFAAACFGAAYLLEHGNDAGLEMLADRVNDSSPSMPDTETRIDGASVDGKVLTYHMTLVHVDMDDVDMGATKARLQARVVRKNCGIPLIQTLLEHGNTLDFAYQDEYGAQLLDVAVDGPACGVSDDVG